MAAAKVVQQNLAKEAGTDTVKTEPMDLREDEQGNPVCKDPRKQQSGPAFSTDDQKMDPVPKDGRAAWLADRDKIWRGQDQAKPQSVTLPVTPGMEVPTKRLGTVSLTSRIQSRASKLVDEGGLMECGDQKVIQEGHQHGFIAASVAAFANHYPIALRPQHFWQMILQGIAEHVEKNAEKVRKQWVAFEGKKTLTVVRNGFKLGSKNNWQSVIYGTADCFPAQIAKNVVDGVAEQLSPTFSGTTLVEHVAMNVTVMDVCKSFFAYRCCTCCGFPSVTMEGSLADWQKLRKTAEGLITERCTSEFSTFWAQALLPLLDKFVEEYQKGMRKEVGDERFWNAMCKRDGRGGSGARTWFSGWFNIFFPYISGRQNYYCRPYDVKNTYEPKDSKEEADGGNEQQRMWYRMSRSRMVGYKGEGPDIASFPKGLAQAPVTWEYYGKEIDLTFKAGLIGAEQDADGTIRPVSGWFIEEGKCEKGQSKMEGW